MNDDPALLERQSAYLESLRGLGRSERTAGFVACLIGVVVLGLARLRFVGETWLLWTGLAVVGLGWALFLYSVVRRLAWTRAHPFDPNG